MGFIREMDGPGIDFFTYISGLLNGIVVHFVHASTSKGNGKPNEDPLQNSLLETFL